MSTPAPQYPNRAAQLRARLLGQNVPPAVPIEIDGEKFFIRTALMADRTKIGEVAGLAVKAKKNEETGEVSVDLSNVPMAAMVAAALIVLAVDEVGNPICGATDLDSLINTPAGGWVQTLGEACLKASAGVQKKGEGSGEAAPGSPSSSQTA